MKKLLPIVLLLLLALASCKKENPSVPNPTTTTGTTGQGSARITISGLSLYLGNAGTLVIITGTNFGTSATGVAVLFNGVAGTIQSVTDTEIKVVMPVTTSGNITLTIGSETVTGPAFTYAIPITVTGISPSTVTAGTIVTLSGTNFGTSTAGASVLFNGSAGTVQSVTETAIKVVVPSTTSGNVIVGVNGQTVAGPAFTYENATVAGISPSIVSAGAIVTISGTNFGTSTAGLRVLFNGVAGTIQSVTPSEIKAVVPVTTSGTVTITIAGQNLTGPAFTYTSNSPLTAPYTSGNVTLTTQAEVDAFVLLNKGRQLQINGSLNISGNDMTSVAGLSNITSVSGTLSIGACPLLTDVSFLNSITSAGSLSVQNSAVNKIAVDRLTGSIGSIIISSCKNLISVSLKSITGVTSKSIVGSIRITACELLSGVDFSSLSSNEGGLFISGTAIADLSGFSSLQTSGSLTLSGNPSLVNFHGLEQLTALTLPVFTGVLAANVINGIYINNNVKLTSLNGLQNLKTVPIARIITNAMLNDFCPLKTVINTLSKLPAYSYRNPNSYNSTSIAALTMTNNGNYPTTQKALEAVALCN
ncbi:MAG: hypothetical protein EOP45_01700 [Sphingobacteriaceae bacterium]|nr:MAG: hypothetical protein EOP45_01700 [Sphingobacteriaceae bacterium]